MEEIDTKKTEKKVSVFGEQKAWASLAFVLKSPMCKQNGIVKSWTKQAAPAVMETAKKKQVPDSRKQSFDQPFSPKTPWRGPVLRKSNHVKLFPTKSRINEMAARERQLESERLEAMEAVRSELSNGTKNTRKKKKLVEVEQPQKEKEIRKPPLPPLKFIKSPPRDPNIPSAANEFTRMTMDAFRYFPTGNPKFYHDFFDQTMSYDARIMANENVFCHSPRIATSELHSMHHPVYRNSYDKDDDYKEKLASELKSILPPIVKPRVIRESRPIKVSRLREPIDGLENALLRTIAEQKIEQTRMTKIHSVTGALDWIGPKSELPHGHKANEGRTHSSRATCKSAATRHRQHLDILAASNEDCPTSGDARHTRSTLLRQRKAREAASPEGNVRLCQEKKMRDHMSKDENKQSILTYWVSQPKAQDTFLLATNINRGNRLDTGSIVSSSYSGMLPEVDKDKQFSERVKRMNIVGCVDVKGVWAKLRSITRLCSADNFSVSSTPLRAGGNTFDDSPTTSRTNDVDKGDVNKVSFSRDRQMDVVDDICKYIKHKVKRQKFLTGIPSITIEDKRETSTSESSSSEYQTSDISQTSTPFSTDKAKPDEGAINITTELIDSLITDSPSDVQDEQDKDSVFIREVSSADRVDYLAYLQRAGFAQLNVKMTGKAMKLCPSRSQNQPTDLQGANIRHVPDVNTVSPNSFTDITIVTEPDETAFPSEQPTDVFVVDETVIGPQTDDPSERSKTPEKRPSAPLGRRRNSFEESLVQSNRPAAERRHEQRVMTQLEANAEQALASDSSWRLVDEDAEEDDESFIKDYTGSVVSVGDVNDKERVAPTAMLPTENLLSRRSDTEGTI